MVDSPQGYNLNAYNAETGSRIWVQKLADRGFWHRPTIVGDSIVVLHSETFGDTFETTFKEYTLVSINLHSGEILWESDKYTEARPIEGTKYWIGVTTDGIYLAE